MGRMGHPQEKKKEEAMACTKEQAMGRVEEQATGRVG